MVPISPENTELREFFVYKSHPAYYYVLVILGAASDATLDNDAPGFCSWGRSYLVVISIFETTTSSQIFATAQHVERTNSLCKSVEKQAKIAHKKNQHEAGLGDKYEN